MSRVLLIVLLFAAAGCTTAPKEPVVAKPVKAGVPDYSIDILSHKVEPADFSDYSGLQGREDYSQIASKELEDTLAGEYNAFQDFIASKIAGAPPVSPAPPPVLECTFNKESGLVSIKAVTAPLSEVVMRISVNTGRSVIIDLPLDNPVTFTAENITVQDALELAAREGYAEMQEIKGIVNFKRGIPLSDIILPVKVTRINCRIYMNMKDKMYYGEIIIYHETVAALHLIYTVEPKTFDVKSLRIFATWLAGRMP
jgi:hypothetical protein